MSELDGEIQEQSEYDKWLNRSVKKTYAELEIEKHYPNLPSWIIKEYTAEGFMWLSAIEKDNLINFGFTGGLSDPWTDIGG